MALKDLLSKVNARRQKLFKAFSRRPKTAIPRKKRDVSNATKLIQLNSVYEFYNSQRYGSNAYDISALYTVLGLPQEIYYTDYEQKYNRQDIAARIVKSPVLGSWRHEPTVYDVKGENTAFNTRFEQIEKDSSLYMYLTKADLLATLGRYSVLYLGLNDGKVPTMPANRATGLIYLSPIPENRAEINTWDEDASSPRYGLPATYSITINTEVTASVSQTVDYTRVIHIAENTLDSEVYGIPFLKPIFNNLIGLDTLSLCSPVMFKGGARPGYVAQPDESAIVTDDNINEAKEQIQSYLNDRPNLPRWLYMQGMKITPLPVQVVSPMDHVNVQLKLISAATRIPLRILTGSERGELASNQDERSWLNYLEERRLNVSERLILRPTIDRFIELGILPKPQGGEYTVEWPPLIVKSELEQVEISLKKAQTVKTRNEAIGGEQDYPNDQMYKDWGMTDEEIEGMEEELDTMAEDEVNTMQQEEQNDELRTNVSREADTKRNNEGGREDM